jgi:hypothetical protein
MRTKNQAREKRKGAAVFGPPRLLKCGYCPHPSNHLMEGFTNHLIVDDYTQDNSSWQMRNVERVFYAINI